MPFKNEDYNYTKLRQLNQTLPIHYSHFLFMLTNFPKLSFMPPHQQQKTLLVYGVKKPERILLCPSCGGNLEFVMLLKKPPPEEIKSQRELLDWISCNS